MLSALRCRLLRSRANADVIKPHFCFVSESFICSVWHSSMRMCMASMLAHSYISPPQFPYRCCLTSCLGTVPGKCAARGVKSVVIAPYFLSRGRHIQEDIPALVKEAQLLHPSVHCVVAEPIGALLSCFCFANMRPCTATQKYACEL